MGSVFFGGLVVIGRHGPLTSIRFGHGRFVPAFTRVLTLINDSMSLAEGAPLRNELCAGKRRVIRSLYRLDHCRNKKANRSSRISV